MNTVTEAIDAHLLSVAGRKHHKGLSVSDVSNGCSRAAWHRIHTGTEEVHGPKQLMKFQWGHMYEAFVREALLKQGWTLRSSEVLIVRNEELLFPKGGQLEVKRIDADLYDKHPEAFADEDYLVGHPDIAGTPPGDPTFTYFEVKTTCLYNRFGKDPYLYTDEELFAKQMHYLLQGAAYAKLYGYETFGVNLADRGTGDRADYVYATEDIWPEFLERWEMMLEAVQSSKEPMYDLPEWTKYRGVSYLCKNSCPVLSCALNLKKEETA